MKYGVILADPPWTYDDRLGRRGAHRQYPLMTFAEICRQPVECWALDDAALFLWATSPLLPDALKVIGAWGFRYRASAVWDKVHFGCGRYWRIQHEFVLLATRGKPGRGAATDLPSVIRSKRREHSRKPDELYRHIEAMYPHADKLELFARQRREGWDSWGNDVSPEHQMALIR